MLREGRIAELSSSVSSASAMHPAATTVVEINPRSATVFCPAAARGTLISPTSIPAAWSLRKTAMNIGRLAAIAAAQRIALMPFSPPGAVGHQSMARLRSDAAIMKMEAMSTRLSPICNPHLRSRFIPIFPRRRSESAPSQRL